MEEESTPVTETIEYPAMTLDADDRLHIIYRRPADKRIVYFSRDADGQYSEVVNATPPDIGNPAFYRTLDTDEEGRFYFTFQNSVATAPVGFFLVSGIDGVFEDPVLVWNDPEDLYLLRNSSAVAARGDGEVAVTYTPSASRDGDIVSDIFLKRGFLFADAEAIIEVSPQELDFGTLGVDSTATLSLTAYNQGAAALTIHDLAIDTDVFFTAHETPLEIPPYGNADIEVTFAPGDEGDFISELVIHSNASNDAEVTIPLFGNGLLYEAIIDVTESVQFYNVPVGSTAESAAGIFNDGNIDLEITELYISGDDEDLFHVSAELPITLQPGSELIIPVYFSPNEAGEFESELIIHSNAANWPETGIWIYGEAYEDDTSLQYAGGGELHIYPNPARENLHIKSDELILMTRLIDMLGQVVYHNDTRGNQISLDIRHLHPGVYFLQITTRHGVHTQRVQISR